MTKKVVIVLACLTSLVMFFLTMLSISDLGRHVFAGGSSESTMKFFQPNKWVVIGLYVSMFFFIIMLKKNYKLLTPIIGLLLVLWFLSTRTVGVHWTGEIKYGWFNIETGKIDVSQQFLPETIENPLEKIIVNKEILGFVSIKGNESFCIYLGPLLSNDFLNYFSKQSVVDTIKPI